MSSATAYGSQQHVYAGNNANNRQAQVCFKGGLSPIQNPLLTLQLGNAYQELAKELSSEKLKVVGGYTLGRVIGEGVLGL